MCPYKEWFDTYKEYNINIVQLGNDSSSKVIGISTVKVRMFDNVVRPFNNVKHVPKLRRSLISLESLENFSYDFFCKEWYYEDQQRCFDSYEREKVKKLMHFDWKDNFSWSYESGAKS